ncbi:MAG: NfeD family protein [Planctomycetota bacterium]|jgi:membrane-bound serine protease (ClpP class)|nr:NfeD family protein [Planctomycetota bacterium]MDP7130127.1 NfeD family protein [Planctomycetota bacterium]MDP7252260.1 NfeD family protein [Planctomycetota bacterium]
MNIDLHIIWILFVIGLAFVTGELFIPGGIVGIIGGALIIVAAGSAFYQESPMTGIFMIVSTLIVIPAGIMIIMPRHAVKAELSSDDGFNQGQEHHRLIGASGHTVSPLRPMGTAEIEGERYSVQAEHGLIDPEVEVTVTRVEGNTIFVREEKG